MIAKHFFEFYCAHNDFYFVNEAPKALDLQNKCQNRLNFFNIGRQHRNQ